MTKSRDTKVEKERSWALRSGYPFENDVFEVIQKIGGAAVDRDWQFPAKDEEGNPTHRSLDFNATYSWNTCNIKEVLWRRGEHEKTHLQFLIEAKSTDSERYLFIPTEPNDSAFSGVGFPALVPGLLAGERTVTQGHQELLEALRDLSAWPTALRGRKVDEQKRERESVSPALIQLIQGTLATIETQEMKLGTVMEASDSSFSRDITVFVPVIVTNAPLLVLKQGISTKQVQAAGSEEEIFNRVEKLLVAQPNISGTKELIRATLHKVRSRRVEQNLAWHEPNLDGFPLVFCTLEGLDEVIREFIETIDQFIKMQNLRQSNWGFGQDPFTDWKGPKISSRKPSGPPAENARSTNGAKS